MEFAILWFYRFAACLGKRRALNPRLAHRHHSWTCWVCICMLQVTTLPVTAQKVARARARAKARQTRLQFTFNCAITCKLRDVWTTAFLKRSLRMCQNVLQLSRGFHDLVDDHLPVQGPIECWQCGGMTNEPLTSRHVQTHFSTDHG